MDIELSHLVASLNNIPFDIIGSLGLVSYLPFSNIALYGTLGLPLGLFSSLKSFDFGCLGFEVFKNVMQIQYQP